MIGMPWFCRFQMCEKLAAWTAERRAEARSTDACAEARFIDASLEPRLEWTAGTLLVVRGGAR